MGRRKARHGNILKPSTMDLAALSMAVEERFLRLCGDYLRIKGQQMPIPHSLDADLLRWRQMVTRHRKGDFRNTKAEMMSIKVLAQWTLDMNCELRNQKKQDLDWGDFK